MLYASNESAETGVRSLIEPMLQGLDGSEDDRKATREMFQPAGENLFLLARNVGDYVALGARLGDDERFRQLAGNAGRVFVERFMTDRARFARIYAEHIVAICQAPTKKGP